MLLKKDLYLRRQHRWLYSLGNRSGKLAFKIKVMIKFSLFPNIKNTKGKEINLKELESQFQNINNSINDKKKLPAFSVTGVWDRKKDKPDHFNRVLHVDIDDVENAKEVFEELSRDEYVFLAFVSPSGRGVKAFAIGGQNLTTENYRQYAEKFCEYIQNKYNLNPDKKTSVDIKRLCFIPYTTSYKIKKPKIFNVSDQELKAVQVLTETAQIFTKENESDNLSVQQKINEKSKQKAIEIAKRWTEKKYQFVKGQRNAYVNLFAFNLNLLGIEQSKAIEIILSAIQTSKDFTESEVKSTIASVYRHCAAEHGVRAWIISDDVSNIVKKNRITGEGLSILLHDLRKCYLIRDDGDSRKNVFFLGFVQGNEVSITDENGIIEIIKERLFERFPNHQVMQIIDNSVSRFSEKRFMAMAPSIQIQNDNSIYFLNAKIDSQGNISIYDDTESKYDGFILKENIKPIYLKKTVDKECIFSKFIKNAVGPDKINFARLVIGYILSQDRNDIFGRAVCLMDENAVDGDQINGGTGKSLFTRGLSKVLKSTIFPMKNIKIDSQFAFQTVDASSKILIFDDIKSNFSLEKFYNLITDGIYIERKGESPFILPPEYGYKVLITSNYTIPIKGDSDRRRRIDLVFTNYYNSEFTPRHEFGNLFVDWDNSEWSRFYHFMADCLKFYRQEGFDKLIELNVEINKHLYSDLSLSTDIREFIDEYSDIYMEDLKRHGYLVNARIYADYNHWAAESGYRQKKTKKRVTSSIKRWLSESFSIEVTKMRVEGDVKSVIKLKDWQDNQSQEDEIPF